MDSIVFSFNFWVLVEYEAILFAELPLCYTEINCYIIN